MSSPYAQNQEKLLALVKNNVKGLDSLYKRAHKSNTVSPKFGKLIEYVTLELQDNMDMLTPENYIYAYNNILTPDMRTFMRETPVMYLPPLRPFSQANITRKNRRNKRSRGGNPLTGLPPLPYTPGEDNNIHNNNWYNYSAIAPPIHGTPYDVFNWLARYHQIEKIHEVRPLINQMFENGADVNETRNGWPLLHRVFSFLKFFWGEDKTEERNIIIAIIEYMVNHGADINSVDNSGRTLLDNELWLNPSFLDVQFLVNHGARIRADNITGRLDRGGIGSSALLDPDVTLLLLDAAPQAVLEEVAKYTDETGGNLLHHFVSLMPRINEKARRHPMLVMYPPNVANIPVVIQRLIEIGINPEDRNQVGQTPARLATNMGLNDIAAMLTVHPRPHNRKTRNIYGFTNETMRIIRANQNRRRANATQGGRRRTKRRR